LCQLGITSVIVSVRYHFGYCVIEVSPLLLCHWGITSVIVSLRYHLCYCVS